MVVSPAIAVAVALTLATLTAGCGGSDETTDERYLRELRAQDSYFEALMDERILELADSMCDELDRGAHLSDLNQGSYGLDLTQEQVPLMFVFAIKARCPDHDDLLSEAS